MPLSHMQIHAAYNVRAYRPFIAKLGCAQPPSLRGHPHHLRPQFGKDEWKQHDAGLPEDSGALDHGLRQASQLRGGGQQDPDGVEGDGEEVIEEDERLPDDAREQADRPVDARAAGLEVAEAAELEDFELRV